MSVDRLQQVDVLKLVLVGIKLQKAILSCINAWFMNKCWIQFVALFFVLMKTAEKRHRNSINEMCNNITSILLNCGQEAFPKCKNKKKKPYWLKLVEPSQRKALFWHAIWCQNAKPNEGYIAEISKKTRSEYHKTVRSLNEKDLRNKRMVNRIIGDKSRTLWNEVKKLNTRKCSVPVCMDQATTSEEIMGVFKEKFQYVYNCNPTEPELLANIENEINRGVRYSSKKNVTMVTAQIVKEAISILNKGKSDGLLGLQTDHLIHFDFSSMLVHGYLPDDILHSITIPIPKNTKGNMSCSDNYRGIALCSPLSKLFECIILNQFSSCLHSRENQFAFKHEHSTVIRTTVFKETVQYYRNRNSNVYACLVDATKAFDYLKFGKLFEILLKSGLHCTVIRTFLLCILNNVLISGMSVIQRLSVLHMV